MHKYTNLQSVQKICATLTIGDVNRTCVQQEKSRREVLKKQNVNQASSLSEKQTERTKHMLYRKEEYLRLKIGHKDAVKYIIRM